MKLTAIMQCGARRGEIYQFSRKVSHVSSWQIISTSTSGNFTIFLRALQMHFLHSTSETKEINNLLLWHQLIMVPKLLTLVFTSSDTLSPWVCNGSADVLVLSNVKCHFCDQVMRCYVFHLAGTLSLAHLLAPSAAASWHMGRYPMEKPMWEGLWPTAGKKQWGLQRTILPTTMCAS